MTRVFAALLLSSPAVFASDASSAWTLQSTSTVQVKAGALGTASVEVVPRTGAHVSPEAPVSLSLTAPKGISVAKTKLGRPDAKETAQKGVRFEVPFTARQSGELKGRLSFFICTDKLCERQTKDLAFAVRVE